MLASYTHVCPTVTFLLELPVCYTFLAISDVVSSSESSELSLTVPRENLTRLLRLSLDVTSACGVFATVTTLGWDFAFLSAPIEIWCMSTRLFVPACLVKWPVEGIAKFSEVEGCSGELESSVNIFFCHEFGTFVFTVCCKDENMLNTIVLNNIMELIVD